MNRLDAIVVMGVSGSGKSTVGTRLATRLGWRWVEGDDVHSPESRRKLAAGQPLTDLDRAPWLETLANEISTAASEQKPMVLACSALKKSYRAVMRAKGEVRFVFLHGRPEVLRERLRARKNHFAATSLLESQLATLETPDEALVLDIETPIDALVAHILEAFEIES